MVHVYQLPIGFAVTFRLSPCGIECEWSPHVPTERAARRLLPYYRRARDHFLSSLGLQVLVIEQ
jgi:hypothetical protein